MRTANIYYLNWNLSETDMDRWWNLHHLENLKGEKVMPTVADLHDASCFTHMGEMEIDGHAFEQDMAMDEKVPHFVLEDIYSRLQNGETTGPGAQMGRRGRSMSMGDVVSIDGYLFVVAACGFEMVE